MSWIFVVVLVGATEAAAAEANADTVIADESIADESIADEPIADDHPALHQREEAPPDQRDESGLTLTFGWGPSFGGLGLSLGYTFEPSAIVHLTPYVGGGLSILEINGTHETWAGTAGGFLASFGRRHRAIVDVTFGTTEYEGLVIYGYELRRRTWGVSALAGYAFVTKNHFMVRAAIGPSRMVAPYSPEGDRWSLSSVLAVGKVF